MPPEWLLLFIVHGDLRADLADAVTGGLPYSVVVGLRLRDIVRRDGVRVLADDCLACVTEYLPPGLDAVVADALSNVVAIQTHPGDERLLVLRVGVLALAVLDREVEGARAETGRVPDLGPIVTQSLRNERHELLAERVEAR